MQLGRPIIVRFVVDKAALQQAFSARTWDHPSQYHPPSLHIYIYIYVYSSNIVIMTSELFAAWRSTIFQCKPSPGLCRSNVSPVYIKAQCARTGKQRFTLCGWYLLKGNPSVICSFLNTYRSPWHCKLIQSAELYGGCRFKYATVAYEGSSTVYSSL